MFRPVSKALLKKLRALRLKKTRRETGLFLVEGVRACEALARGPAQIETVLVTSRVRARERAARLLEALDADGHEILTCSEQDIGSVADAASAQGLLAVCRWQDRDPEEMFRAPFSLALALDHVANPGNVGTVIRAADWFGADAVVLSEGCADVLNPRTVRASAGSLFHVPVWREAALPAILARLREGGCAVIAADQQGEPDLLGWRGPRSVLVLGSEADGLSAEIRGLADRLVAVPRAGRAESLNVAMAAVALMAGAAARRS